MKPFDRVLVAATLLVMLVNALILGGVAWNRRAPPESVLILSERELWMRPDSEYLGSEESSGLSARLQWAVEPAHWDTRMDLSTASAEWGTVAWLDAAKLAALGFDVSRRLDDPRTPYHYRRMPPRDVLLVLELDGPAYATALKRMNERAAQAQALAAASPEKDSLARQAQSARESAEREARKSTRLFVVDAGLDAGELRARYPDRSHYAIVRGSVKPQVAGPRMAQELLGRVTAVRCAEINVPPQLRARLPRFPEPYDRPRQPFQLGVAVGRRFEPWIMSASSPSPAPAGGGR
jgi:uncharacterized protein DUF4824